MLFFLSNLEHFRNLLFILATIAEPVRPFRRMFDLLFQPNFVTVFVLAPVFPLAIVPFELRLIHHGHAFFDGADGFAHATPATSLHVRVIQTFRSYIETRIRTLQPAQRALDAGIEIHHGPHGSSAEFQERGVAVGLESSLRVRLWIVHLVSGGYAWDSDAFAHFMPLGQVEFVRHFRIPLVRGYRDAGG